MDFILKRFKEWGYEFGQFCFLILIGAVIGAVTAFFEFIYGEGLKAVLKVHSLFNPWILIGLPFAGLLIVWLFERFGRLSRRGMNLVFQISQGQERWIPKRTISLMMVSTWISNLFGASVGREGVAMQIGTAIASFFNRHLPQVKHSRTIFLVTGMAAGFAGLFGTPYTAVFFALEVLVAGTLKFRALASTMAAALTASWIGGELGMYAEIHYLPAFPNISTWQTALCLVGIGLIFGLVGGTFAWLSRKFHHLAEKKIPNPYQRIFWIGTLMAVLLFLFYQGRYSNYGTNLIEAAFSVGLMPVYPWDWLLKMLMTVICLSIGYVGGEVTPLFAVGSALGFVIGPFFGMDPMWGAALGYAAVFGAGTNTWLAPMMCGIEIFGFDGFPAFFIVCSVAYLVNHSQSIYVLQERYDESREL